ncbi:MAG: permease [Deltaproteobacteria bacterium]|nr:permease [Deltaproteobacteria bacterium]MBW2392719.1 permease [Deltaproteobacteria bacterium]
MKTSGLSFDDIPPLDIPLRFHITAPVFGLLAALFLFWEGPEAWMSRWTIGSLGATHLLTLGFMAMVMIGSLFQLVPVLSGQAIPAMRWVAPWVHVMLTAGVIVLTVALVRPDTVTFTVALALLGFAFAAFIPPLVWRLVRIRGASDAIFTIRLAAISLLMTVGMGIFLSVGRGWPDLGIAFRSWTDVHVLWALFGWVPLLVMGVSYQVMPMFHVAPAFDSRLARGIPLSVFVSLLLLSHARSDYLVAPIVTVLCGALMAYSATALRVLAKRHRKRADPMIGFWRTALISLALAAVSLWFAMATPVRLPFLRESGAPLLIGILMVFGFACSMIIGMLQKIVPFLIFLHLQRRALGNPDAMSQIPTTNEVITDRDAHWQLRIHLIACAGILAALVWPAFARPAALLLAADFGWLFRNLISAAGEYRRRSQAIGPAPNLMESGA